MALPPMVEVQKKKEKSPKMHIDVTTDIVERQKRIDAFAVLHKLTLNCDPHYADAISKKQDMIEIRLSELEGLNYALDERLQKRVKKPYTTYEESN